MITLTQSEINARASKFNVGDIVIISENKSNETGKGKNVLRSEGKVLARSAYSLLIGRGDGYKTKESFTYADIVLTGCIEKKKGRPSKV